MDTLVGMRAFARVVESKNFAEAARRLKLSPAMVTKHIQNLEQRIGTRLLNRTPRQLSLTEAGAAYYERCVNLLAEIEDAEAEAGAFSRLPRGRLRISAAVDFGATELRPLVQKFMHEYPDISVDLALTNRFVDLVEEEFDLAVRIVTRRLHPSLVARKLAVSRFVVCASPAYLRRAGTPKIPDDLQAHRWLNYSEAPTRDEWRLTRDGKSKKVNIAHGLRSNHNHLLCDAAVDGAGICIQPTFNVWRHIATGRLKTVLNDWSIGELGIHVVFPNRKFLPAKTRLFIDFLAASFPRGPQHDVWRDRARSRSTRQG